MKNQPTTAPIVSPTGRSSPDHRQDESGQATAEYALVMLAAAALGGSVLAWAVGTDAIGRLMTAVIDSLIGQI